MGLHIRRKCGEALFIGAATLRVVQARNGTVEFDITHPPELPVEREERILARSEGLTEAEARQRIRQRQAASEGQSG
jgi:sRNA-binding carbon storage regulator CsrA